MPDPELFVERFSHQVAEWEKWHKEWRSTFITEETMEIDDSASVILPGYSAAIAKVIDDVAEMLHTQDQVNVMILATLDELKKK